MKKNYAKGVGFLKIFDPIVLRSSGTARQALNNQKSFQRLRREAKLEQSGLVSDILRDMDLLDSKSSALLTHVSVMIAALALSLGAVEASIVKFALAIELGLYVCVAMLALRCLNFMGPPNMDGIKSAVELQRIMLRECTIRRHIYFACLRFTIYLTVAIPVIILVEVISEISS